MRWWENHKDFLISRFKNLKNAISHRPKQLIDTRRERRISESLVCNVLIINWGLTLKELINAELISAELIFAEVNIAELFNSSKISSAKSFQNQPSAKSSSEKNLFFKTKHASEFGKALDAGKLLENIEVPLPLGD